MQLGKERAKLGTGACGNSIHESLRNALILVHNSIHQTGIKALQVSLAKNTSMVKLLGIFGAGRRQGPEHVLRVG